MPSLKAFLPQLAKIVGKTADELYSRQRALIQIGVLKAVEGRGPGSGVSLSGDAVAAIIIALMAADNLQQTTATRVLKTCHARPPKGGTTGRLSGAINLQNAIGRILLAEEGNDMLSINRGFYADVVCGKDTADELTTRFVIRHSFGRPPPFKHIIEMEPEHLRYISRALRSALGDST
jgi:hypothetical protein